MLCLSLYVSFALLYFEVYTILSHILYRLFVLTTALNIMPKVFTAQALKSARAIQQRGHVLNLKLWDGLVKAWVRGDHGQLYDIYMDLKTWPNTVAKCRCQSLRHCEHAAACLFALQVKTCAPQEMVVEPVMKPTEPALSFDEIEWYSDIKEKKTDFFEYQLGIIVNNKRINILPLVVEKLQQMDRTYWESAEAYQQQFTITLPDGRDLNLPGQRLKILIDILLATGKLAGSPQKALQLMRYQLLIVQEAELALQATMARWQGTQAIRQSLQSLLAYESKDFILPKSFNAALRSYQYQGFCWLQCLREHHFGGILADDMGLGKTVQTLAHLLYEKQQGRLQKACLIVAPMSLLCNWLAEGKRFAPDLRMVIYHGSSRKHIQFSEYDVILSTYGLVQRSKDVFLNYRFYYVILDEAQWIKNARTLTAQKIQQLQATHRLCLTGTPIENHLGELWSLFNFLMPGLLGTARQFHQYFRLPIESGESRDRSQLLSGRVSSFMLRRTKSQVLDELPPKTIIKRSISLTGKQRDLYEAIRLTMESRVREELQRFGLAKSRWVILDALLKLRQVCCDPRLVKLPEAEMAYGSSAKLMVLLELLETLMSENRRVLIFSQFTSMLALIEAELAKRNYAYLKLTGKITQVRERQKLIDTFQTGEVPIFLLSLKTGGFGVNLTRADTVIHYDPWWNPAAEEQATDRSHRIGQTQPVFVYKLITEGTVEAVIQQMQEKKQGIVDDIFSTKVLLTEAMLSDFFQPHNELK